MLTYKHILITTDLSEHMRELIAHLREIVQHSEPKLSIIHVLEHTPIVYGSGEFSIPLDINLEETLRNQAQQALAQLSKELNISEKNQYIEMGSIKKAVVDLASRLGVDLIVVGAHGRHGVERMLGSTANAILHAAKCDVLAVRVKH